jgi:hypothetical protein
MVGEDEEGYVSFPAFFQIYLDVHHQVRYSNSSPSRRSGQGDTTDLGFVCACVCVCVCACVRACACVSLCSSFHQHHRNIDLLEHAVRHWYSGASKDTILAQNQSTWPASCHTSVSSVGAWFVV